MTMVFPVILFVAGLAVLIIGADFLVKGASSLAKTLSVSEIAIGLTVVAFGTSTPELVVNIFASSQGYNAIVFGNVIGSNILNILVILGISGLIYPLAVQKNTVWKEIPFSLLAVLLLFVLVNDTGLFHTTQNSLSFIDGVVLLLFFIIFLTYVFGISKIVSRDSPTVKIYPTVITVTYIVLGFAGLFFGGKLVVDNAVLIARALSVSEKLIALTIVAGGTSLPELATSAVAAYRKRCDIAVGNIVGSNIFNICFVLGISSIIQTSTYDSMLNIDVYILLFSTLILFLTMFTGRAHKLDRWESAFFLFTYVSYLIYVLYRK
jgi:cation:H+ antiporter